MILVDELIRITMNKFIHIVSSPFSQRDYDRYGVAILQADGFDVEVWNVGKVVNRDAYEKTAHLSGRFEIETVFDTKNEFLESCRKQEKLFFSLQHLMRSILYFYLESFLDAAKH